MAMSLLKKMRARLREGVKSERGSVAVEAALGIVAIYGIATLLVDMHQIHLERTALETTTTQLVQNTVVLPKLTRPALDALVENVAGSNTLDTEIYLMNVYQSGKINWMLKRGDGALLCELPVDGKLFTGDLPVDPPEGSEDEEDMSEMSMVVVEVCRRSHAIKLIGKWSLPRVMQVQTILRAVAKDIELDEELEEENLVKDTDKEAE